MRGYTVWLLGYIKVSIRFNESIGLWFVLLENYIKFYEASIIDKDEKLWSIREYKQIFFILMQALE